MTSKRLRYEILRRDNYACRYCGGAAPGVELTVDHVTPVAPPEAPVEWWNEQSVAYGYTPRGIISEEPASDEAVSRYAAEIRKSIQGND